MLHRLSLVSPAMWGLVGTALIAVGSFGAGATRNRGGVMDLLGLNFLTFGHGQGIMGTLMGLGVFLLLVGWVLLGRRTVVDRPVGEEERFALVRRAMWLWIVPLIVAAPILSRDVYSYLMQGAMTRDGFDPYEEGAAVNPGPYLLEVSHDWRNTTTPYGPLHLWIGEGVTTVVGDNVAAGLIAYKIISLIGFAAIAWAIPRIATLLGGDPALALWLGVANPVMILHMIGGMHNESVMVGLVSVGLLFALQRRFVIGVVLIAVAVSLKATAAVALPFVVWIATNHFAGRSSSAGRKVVAFLLSGSIGAALTLAVVGFVTWASGSSWGWLAEISGNSKVVNPLALPTFVADVVTPFIQLFVERFPYNTVLSITRTVGSILMLVGLVVIWWLFRQSDRRAIMGTTLAYQWAYMVNAVALPWYYASVITLVGTFRPPLWALKLTTGASIFLALAFTGGGNHRFYDTWFLLGGLLVAWIATSFIFPLDAAKRPGVASPREVKTPSPERA